MFGEAVKRDWTGKRVTIKASVVEHGREKGKPCIRICASADIPADQTVVIDFHTKRIKPFTIRIRSGMHTPAAKSTAPARGDGASAKAKELATMVRAAVMASELGSVVDAIEECLVEDEITKDEGSQLMSAIEKKSQSLSEKAATNVIT